MTVEQLIANIASQQKKCPRCGELYLSEEFYSQYKTCHENRSITQISDTEPEQQTTALVRDDARKAQGTRRTFIRFILFRTRLLDADAKWGSVKDVLDGLQHSRLIPGDREDQITLEVIQRKISHRKDERTVIEIEYPE